MDKDKIKDYLIHRDECVKVGRGAAFQNAVHKIDEFIVDPYIGTLIHLFILLIFADISVERICEFSNKKIAIKVEPNSQYCFLRSTQESEQLSAMRSEKQAVEMKIKNWSKS